MILIYWRGRVLRHVAKMLDRWAWIVTLQANRDLAHSVRPENDLFDR